MIKRRKWQRPESDFSPMFRHFANILCNRIKINGLPEEINEHFFKYHVLMFGRILFFKDNGKYHVMWFAGHGSFNEYYVQNKFLSVDPWRKSDKSEFDENNASIVFSDVNAYLCNEDVGLYDFCANYADIVNSIDKSIKALAKNSKVIAFITGSDYGFVESARRMIDTLFNGDDCIGIMEESLVDNIKVNPISEKMDYKFSELIKARQYYISDFYQKIGVASNQNMKKERLTDNESQLIEGVANVDFNHILDNLNSSIAEVNEKFGLSISFELNEKEPEEKEEEKEDESIVDETANEDNVDNSDDKGGAGE